MKFQEKNEEHRILQRRTIIPKLKNKNEVVFKQVLSFKFWGKTFFNAEFHAKGNNTKIWENNTEKKEIWESYIVD